MEALIPNRVNTDYLPVPQDITHSNYLGTEPANRDGMIFLYVAGTHVHRFVGLDADNQDILEAKYGVMDRQILVIKADIQSIFEYSTQTLGADPSNLSDDLWFPLCASHAESVRRLRNWLDSVRAYAAQYGWSRVGNDVLKSVSSVNQVVGIAANNNQGDNP